MLLRKTFHYVVVISFAEHKLHILFQKYRVCC